MMHVTWASMETLMANNFILEERNRQQTQEGYTPAHDDEYKAGQLAMLAAAYALSSRVKKIMGTLILTHVVEVLTYYDLTFKPQDPIRDLARAGALILAELERRLRLKEKDDAR